MNMTNKFKLGFSTLNEEITLGNLLVKGNIPSWLSGTLIRNGPAKFEVGEQRFRHWFDGLAMLHKFSFNNGKVSYANKFLESRAYKHARDKGEIGFSEFATDPCRSIFKRVTSLFSQGATDNANVNLTKIANHFVALTETPLSIEFNPQTLKTVGVFNYDDTLKGQLTTAHPHYDFEKQEGINYITKFSIDSSYNIYRIPSGKKQRELIGFIPVKEPAYMHSFGVTKNYVILAEFPLIINPSKLLFRGRPFIENYEWKSERGTKFLVIKRHDGKLLGSYESEAFFAFHHINAFEKEDEIIVDVVVYPDASVINTLYLDVLKGDTSKISSQSAGKFRRYHISIKDNSVNHEIISKEFLELPRINYGKFNSKDYRFVYGTSTKKDASYGFMDQLVKIYIKEENSKVWFDKGCYPSEPVFIEKPNAINEDDGIVLSVVLDSKKGNSFLLILDAKSFKEIARAEVPHHIPFGFHGQYYREIF